MDGTVIVKIPRLIGYRKQGFQFTMGAWEFMSSYTQLAYDDFGKIDENKDNFGYTKEESRFIILAYYAAAWAYNVSNEKKISFTEKTVKKWFENMPVKTAQKILNVMMESEIAGRSIIDWMNSMDEFKEKKKSSPLMSETLP